MTEEAAHKNEQLVRDLTDLADRSDEYLKKVEDDLSLKPADMAKVYWAVRNLHDDLKKQLTRIYHVMNALDKGVLPKLFEHHGVDMVRIPELGRSFSIRQMTTASMLDKEQAMSWLRDNGHGDLIQETVNAGTLASFIRNMILEEGIEPPEEMFKVNTYKTIGSNKYNPK
jgi:hypothetical protein